MTSKTSEAVVESKAVFNAAGGGLPNQPGGYRRDEGPDNFGLDVEDDIPRDKSKIVTWFLLLVVLMTFGGLISAYIVIATNGVLEWRPFDLPIAVWVSTALIIVSSCTYYYSEKLLKQANFKESKRWLLITTVLGGFFISSQLFAWLALVSKGLYMSGNPYAGFFYILTGVHAVHVLGGIVALGAILLRNWNETSKPKELEYRKDLARSVGWYWHFMGLLWIVIVILLGFWK